MALLYSFQLSLVAAKKSLVSDDMVTRAARTDTTPTLAQYDSEETITGTHMAMPRKGQS